MVRKFALGIVLAAVAGISSASASTGDLSCKTEYLFGLIPYEACTVVKHPKTTVVAPEFDSSSAIAALTLMLGGLAILTSRRKKSAEK